MHGIHSATPPDAPAALTSCHSKASRHGAPSHGKCLLAPATAVVLLWAFIDSNARLAWAGLIMTLLCVALIFVQWIVAAARTARCASRRSWHQGLLQHRKAKSFLGNYQLQVALAVLFYRSFRCRIAVNQRSLRCASGASMRNGDTHA